jgi:aminoglycoside phosphotransferase (APT) family kinase protein
VIGAHSTQARGEAAHFDPLLLGDKVLSELGMPRLRALVVNTSKDPNAKFAVLLFSPGSPHPTLVIKAPTTDAAELAVLKERRLLMSLHELDLGPLQPTVPRAVRMVEVHGRKALLMTATEGSSMLSRYHRWRHTATAEAVRADFACVSAWLAALQDRTASVVRPLSFGQELPQVLRRRFFDHPAIGETAQQLRRIQAALATSATPLTVVHGDCWIGNLLVRNGVISGAVDWEAGTISGEPVRDLVRFALTYALYLDRHGRVGAPVMGHPGLLVRDWGAGVIYAVQASGWFPDLFRSFLQDGLARLGAAPEHWRLAALAGLAEIAATADHHEFALRHLELFQSLAAVST